MAPGGVDRVGVAAAAVAGGVLGGGLPSAGSRRKVGKTVDAR